MGLSSSVRSLPAGFRGLSLRNKKVRAPKEKATPAGNPSVVQVVATAAEKDSLGLTPPPSALAAPWAAKTDNPSQEEQTGSFVPESQEKSPPAGRSGAAKGTAEYSERPDKVGTSQGQPQASVSKAEQQSLELTQQVAGSSTLRPSARNANAASTSKMAAMPATAAATPLMLTGQNQSVPAAIQLTRVQGVTPLSSLKEPAAGVSNAQRAEPAAPVSDFRLPPAIHFDRFLPREGSASYPDTDADTPLSGTGTDASSGTVVVTDAHQAKLSLSLTASIEDYARKADPANWGRPKFRKSQFMRIEPGTYPVPFKKLAESRSQYTTLNTWTKGKIHQLTKETETRDPREFVMDEGMVLYRVWVPRKVTSNVEFIFVAEEQMTLFHDCALCSAYATDQCSGCKKEWYCSEECQAEDWRSHKYDCKHKGKAPPPLGSRGSEFVSSETPASTATPRPASAITRRKFREDGTVKIINGRNPSPGVLKGHMTIMPACLRPMTLEEEMAPPPSNWAGKRLQAISFRLRRAIHDKHGRRRRAQEHADTEAAPQDETMNDIQTDTIPEGEDEGVEDVKEDKDEGPPDGDGGNDRNDSSNGPDGENGDSGAQPESGNNDNGRDRQGGPEEDNRRGSSSGDRRGSNEGDRRHSSNGGRQGSSNGDRRHSAGGAGPPTSSLRKHGLQALKGGVVAVLEPDTEEGRISHGRSFNSILSSANLQQHQSNMEKATALGMLMNSSAGLESEYGSPTEDESVLDSPGAESLVEGQVPHRRERPTRTATAGHRSIHSTMSQLPRIRVRAEVQPPEVKPSGRPENFPVTKEAQPWPIASMASLGKSPIRKRASPKARKHSRSDSLPEVFKRLTAGSKLPSLAVGSSPTKKIGKAKSPFKRHHPGHRATLLAPAPF